MDGTSRRRALEAVVAFGFVSLLADVVYEGARSVLGPYLGTLGASAALVGLVAGLGEFTAFALRLVSGPLVDRTRAAWSFTIAGYLLTIVAVPLLGVVGRLDLALALVLAERLGKAVRSPARDTLLAGAGEIIGRGRAFGLHEALDQIGAVAGPVVLAVVLAVSGDDYRLAFGILAVPGIAVVVLLVTARRLLGPNPGRAVHPPGSGTPDPGPAEPGRIRAGLTFLAATSLVTLPFPLVAFHATNRDLVAPALVPVVFAAAMGLDALVAVVVGGLYDRRGPGVLVVVPVAGAVSAVALAPHALAVWMGVLAWG
ncbi:MAG: MFS transporter, partial [Actinomyces sp.]